jgi:hypothetical protein
MPNAVKADGDADNDLKVDGADLSVWELQYGTVPLLAAVEGLEGSVEGLGLSVESGVIDAELGSRLRGNDGNSQALLSNDLVDVALAMEWMGQTSIEVDLFTEDEPTLNGAARDAEFASDYSIPVSPVSADSEALQTGSDDENQSEETWLSDELLERVFG